MPAPQKILSENDIRDLKRTVRRSFTDSYSRDFWYNDPFPGAPEIVVAKVPYEGISGSVAIGGGLYQAGYEKCHLYYLYSPDEATLGSSFRMEPMFYPGESPIPIEEWIYNPYSWSAYGKPVQNNLFLRVMRERSGKWVCERPLTTLKCKPTTTIQPSTQQQENGGLVEIWLGGNPSGQFEYAYLNWQHGGNPVAANSEQIIDYFPDESKWVIRAGAGSGEVGVAFINNTANQETIPPYAVMSVPSSVYEDLMPYLLAEKPGPGFQTRWLINGEFPVPFEGKSIGYWRIETSGRVLIGGETFTPGDELDNTGWGPTPEQWYLSKCRMGFDILNYGFTVLTIDSVEYTVSEFIQHDCIRVYGKLTGNLDLTQYTDGDVSAPFKIYYRAADGKLYDAGWPDIDVYGIFLKEFDVVKEGAQGVADWYSDHWEADFTADSAVYIAKVPDSGILARTDVGLVVPNATCDIYKIYPDGVNDTIQDAVFTEKVYNIYPVAHYFPGIPKFIRVFKDRHGKFLCEKPPYRYKCKATEDINPGVSGDTDIYINGAVVDGVLGYNNWMNGGVKISQGKEGIVEYFEDELKWVWVEAECEDV